MVSKSHRYVFWALIILAVIMSGGYALFQVSKSRTFQFFGGLVSRVDTDQAVVALTFDDAPSPRVQEVLAVLQAKSITATFYEIGQQITANRPEAEAIVNSGMEVGNHSYSHQRMLLRLPSFIESEISTTNRLIRDTGYRGEITFRPPNGKKLFLLPYYLRQQQMRTVMWDVEPDTYVPGDAAAIEKYVLDHVRPGSVILMHPFCESGCAADRAALPGIIDNLRSRGYRFVTVSQLINYGG